MEGYIQKYEPSEFDSKKLENNFKYHTPKEDQAVRYENVRDAAKEFAKTLVALCPPSRELSVALTELETAVMWANAAIARNE
jgi:hypothetical protein